MSRSWNLRNIHTFFILLKDFFSLRFKFTIQKFSSHPRIMKGFISSYEATKWVTYTYVSVLIVFNVAKFFDSKYFACTFKCLLQRIENIQMTSFLFFLYFWIFLTCIIPKFCIIRYKFSSTYLSCVNCWRRFFILIQISLKHYLCF